MKNNDCNIVRDLMPLVLDRVASDESREVVEDHISTCPRCRKQYEEMKADMPEETRAEYEEEQRTVVEALKDARRRKKRRKIRLIVLPIVISIAVFFTGVLLYGYLFVWSSVQVDNSLYMLSLAQLKNGSLDVTVEDCGIRGLKYDSTCCEKRKEAEGTVLYLYYVVPPYDSLGSNSRDPANLRKSRFTSFEIHANKLSTDGLVEIRQGKPGNYITLWKKGETIPAASEEMEAYYALDAEYEAQCNEFQSSWNELLSKKSYDAYPAVPEWH